MSSDPLNQQGAANNKKEEEQFPIKLHRILEEAEGNGFSDCISWMPDGTSFKIFDKTRLENEVMPQYFESCQFKSFQRSLNMWGFVADNKKSDTTTGGGRRHHPLFVKGRPELCCAMRRVRVKKPGARGKKALETEGKLTSTPPDSPRTARRHQHEEATAMASGFLAPCQGDRYHDQAVGSTTTDNCSDLVQQLCQSQSARNHALLNALLAAKFQGHDQSIMLSSARSSHPAAIPTTDFANRSLLASTLTKMLSTPRTTTPPPQHVVSSFIMGQPLSAPAINHGAPFSHENLIDEAVLRQAAIALATAGWHSPTTATPNLKPEYFLDPQYFEKLVMMNMLLQQQQQQQQSPTHSSSRVIIEDAIGRNLGLVCGGGGERSNTSTTSITTTGSHSSNHVSAGSTSTGGVSPSQYIGRKNGGLEQNSTMMSTLDLASSLLLQHFSAVTPSSSIGPSS